MVELANTRGESILANMCNKWVGLSGMEGAGVDQYNGKLFQLHTHGK